ncbi:MAG: hypothetical protein WCX71_01500 [Candidatus Buchananbacteria bacterium]
MIPALKKKLIKQKQVAISYEFIDKQTEDNENLNKAFDILFEEVLKENCDLTTMDN